MLIRQPIVRAADEGDERSFLGGGQHVWKLMTDDTAGAFFLFEDTLVRGKSTPLHQHPEADETIYVLEGEILSMANGERTQVGARGMTFMPRGTPHAFMVLSERARLLVFQTPGVGEAFYRAASEPATGDTPGHVDFARLRAAAQANGGVEILGPPPFDLVKVG